MTSLHKLILNGRKKKKRKLKLVALGGSPQRKAICIKVYTTHPKKPNSAVRKVAKVLLSNGFKIIAGIPGEGFKIAQHSVVLVRAGRVPDVPGLRYKLVRGPYEFRDIEYFTKFRRWRHQRRSKYGTPWPTVGVYGDYLRELKTDIKSIGSHKGFK